MARNDKQFDAVGTMRSIRDRISREIDGMTFEEEQAYIYKHLGDEAVARFSGSAGRKEQPLPPPAPDLDAGDF